MTGTAKLYRPAYFSGFDEVISSFETTEELLATDFVESWSHIPNFYRYSLSDRNLMAEFEKGNKWYVVAILSGDVNLNLPKWSSK